MIKSISFIVSTQHFHFNKLKILRQPNQQYFFTVTKKKKNNNTKQNVASVVHISYKNSNINKNYT